MAFVLETHGDSPGDNDEPELYVSVQLNQRYGFLARCRLALGYIMGKRSRFSSGHWDEGSLTPEGALEVQMLLSDYRDAATKWERSRTRIVTSGTVGVA
jgi:hypothetical protein